MAGSPPPAGGLRQQPPLSLSRQAWLEAGELLIPPPEPEEAVPYREWPLDQLLAGLAECHAALQVWHSPQVVLRGGVTSQAAAADCDPRLVVSTLPTGARQGPGLPPFDHRSKPSEAPGFTVPLRHPGAVPALPGLALALLEHNWTAGEREVIRRAADALRGQLVGERVSYVVNRNLNTSNICQLRCGFCAFRRDEGEAGAYRLTRDQLCDRAQQARELGATELCLQAALDPRARLNGSHLAWAEALLRDLAHAAPGLHLHAFSPQELLFFAQADGVPLAVVLHRLQQAGLGSVPGTAAEVLTERVRRVICPEKLSARAWVAVMLQVQDQGLAATSTLMAGHIERPADRVAHLLTLIALQHRAWQHHRRGFSEFVLLPFIGASAPAPLRHRVGRDQPDTEDMLLLTAQARLLLGPWFLHHQPSWVKLTLPQAVEALRWGCDDIGGTLMEEHITTMAGASGGTCQSPLALRRAVAAIGRPLRQRTTLYGEIGGVRASDGSSLAETGTPGGLR